jgi:exopolysaccharide biosynthesis WecB/TagA/CpsF family protein
MTPPTLELPCVRVDLLDERTALARIEELHDQGPPRWVSYVNPHTVNLACRDPTFGPLLAGAGLRLPDGFGLRIAARRRNVRVPAILNGSDFNQAVLRRAATRGWSVFLLGGRAGVADRAARRLRDEIPGLRVAGTRHGFFTAEESGAVAEQIRAARACVVVAALGQPQQERWLERHLAATGAELGLAVGGFLDFAAGTVRRAPPWMNRAGLEWTFRLAQEPRRLAGRYLVGNPVFLWRVCASAEAPPELVPLVVP